MNFKRYHVSKNLFDEIYPNIVTDTPKYKSIYVGDGDFTLSTNCPASKTAAAMLFLLAGNVSGGASTAVNGVSVGISKTVTAVNGYVTIAYRYYRDLDPRDYQTMLNLGSTPEPYEPYSSEVWHDTPHYIHNTSTDTITTLPAVLYPNGTTATVGLKGNMSQSSTPTPSSPIQPQECGERTGNLFDSDVLLEAVGWEKHDNIYSGYSSALHAKFNSFDKCIPVDATVANIKVMFKYENLNTALFVVFWYTDGTSTQSSKNGKSGEWMYLSGESDSNKTLKGIAFSYGTNDLVELKEIMLSTGSSPLRYEPYGYKIPILNGSQTTNVYLGEVESARQIKKLVLTGEETISEDIEYNRFHFTIQDMRSEGVRLTKLFCTHYQNISDGRPIANVPDNSIYIGGGADSQRVFIKTTDYTTATDFKAYLAAQYAAGTPVTVWYVLATSTTGVLNEPLRKIGDYADEVSGISIPTIAGANTISVDTTLQPSEVSATYKGWHPVQSVHEAENGQWD